MKWFKHFENAHESNKVAKIVEEKGLEGEARWFRLLALLTKELDTSNVNSTFELHWEVIATKVKVKRKQTLLKLLSFWEQIDLIAFQEKGSLIEIVCPTLWELQDKHSKYNRKRVASESQLATDKKEKENKNKKKNEKENTYLDAFELLQFWNGLGMKTHEPKPETLRSINEAYQFKSSHGINGNKQAFANYASVLKDPNTWWTAIFSCEGFLKNSGTERFYEPEFNHAEYIKSKPITGSKGSAQARQENLANMEFTENDFA